MPIRIQRKRTKDFNLKAASTNPNGVVYVGRSGRGLGYGNPFKIGAKVDDDTVPNGYWIIDGVACLELFENYCNQVLLDNPNWLEPLRGKDLACWCPLVDKNGDPVPCHADVLLRLANER